MNRPSVVFSAMVLFAALLSGVEVWPVNASEGGSAPAAEGASTESLEYLETLILEKHRRCEELEQRLAETRRRLEYVEDTMPWYAVGMESLSSEDYRACVSEARELEDLIHAARWAPDKDARRAGALVLYRRLVREHGLPPGNQPRDGASAKAVIARLDDALAGPRYERIKALMDAKKNLANAASPAAVATRATRVALGAALERLDEDIAADLDIMLQRFSEIQRNPGGTLKVVYFSRYAEQADKRVVEAQVDEDFKHRVSGGELSPERWARVREEYRLLRRRYPRSAHTLRATKLYAAAIRRPPGRRAWLMGGLALALPLLGLTLSLMFCRRNPERGDDTGAPAAGTS